MLSRKDLEELLGHPISDEDWKENQRIFSELQEKMWAEDHPLEE